jgi:hypothetical protein
MDIYDDVSQFYELNREAEKLALPYEERAALFLDDEGLAQQFSDPGSNVSASLGGLGGLAGLLGGGR